MKLRLVLCIIAECVWAASYVMAQSGSSGIVISQVYGGGGNAGATLRNDYVELFNRGNTAVTVTGWSIQYASASGSSWDRTLLTGVIQPGQYYLVEEAQGSGGSVSLPTPDLVGVINLSLSDGKIVLVSNSTALTGTSPSGSQVVDFVGYGSANASEGSPTAALSTPTAAIRLSGGCTDTNNNRTDFSVGAPAPRNSRSPVNPCLPAIVPPTITSISPGIPTASASNQIVTVTGSLFRSGLTVTLSAPNGGTSTVIGAQILGVSATSFQMTALLSVPGTFGIRVNNPDGGQSATFTFTVKAATSVPIITSISPGTPTANAGNQTMTVSGGQFQAGLTVTLFLPNSGGSSTVSGAQIQAVSSTSFQMVSVLSVPGTFGIRVSNPDGGQSATFNFTVRAATSAPTITSISPGTPTVSTTSQTITVSGSQFQNGLTVTLSPPNGQSSMLSGTQIQSVGVTSFQITALLSATGGYGIRVHNPDGGQSNTFSFNVNAATSTPTIDPTRAALNSASFKAGPVAPGSLVSVFGTNFASGNTLADSIPLPTSLANVTVTFNGIAAPISGVFHDAANGDQINVQVPWELAAVALPATAQMVVTRSGVPSTAQPVSIATAAPGIFAIQLNGGQVVGSGFGQAIAYGNSDGIIAAPEGAITGLATHPAKINDPATLVILATGLGSVDTTVRNGDVPPVITSNTVTKPIVTIGDVPAQVVFAGMVGRDGSGKAFGFVGVYQINVIVAPGTPIGNAVKLQISMNGVTSRPDVTIAVSQ